MIPDNIKVDWTKQAEKKAEKTSTAATAFEDEEMMVLTVLDLQKDNSKISCFDMNDAFNMVPIDKDMVYLNDFEESEDEESDDKAVTIRNLMTKKAVMRNLMTKKGTVMMTIFLS